jgi:hypothetical protein
MFLSLLSVVHFRCLIDPDFAPLVVQLSEIELIRSIDKVQGISCYSVALLLVFLYSLNSVFRAGIFKQSMGASNQFDI